MMTSRQLALLWMLSLSPCAFSQTAAPPLLEIASGLPGKQVRLTWPAEAGVRYRIERSTTLGTWSQLALVEAPGRQATWLDPEPTGTRAFYRVSQPQAEVFTVSPTVLSTTGGVLRIHGQLIPAGSFLLLSIEGQPDLMVPLIPDALEPGVWTATLSGVALPEGAFVSARVVDGAGTTIVPIGSPLGVTLNGLALDGPASLPPAAPSVDLSKPVPGIGVIVKKGRPGQTHRPAGAAADHDDCDDADPFSPLGMAINEKALPAEKKVRKPASAKRPSAGGIGYDDTDPDFSSDGTARARKGYDYYQAQSQLSSSALIARWASRKGYDYYQARSDMSASGLHTNPYFSHAGVSGSMPETGHEREIGPGFPSPAPSGLPGEVSFRSCDLALPCPAGPPLEWVCTYRSKRPVSSGHGPGWDFSYNIWIEAASATAPRVTVHDGGGRADVLHRQADGSYRADGLFREGRFSGDTFTLTFADKGTWTFKPLGSSPEAGKISSITDRNQVSLTCAYDGGGQLESVSDSFGRSLAVEWDSLSPPRIVSVTARASLSLNFTKITYTYDTHDRRRIAATAPFVPGQAPVAGSTTYTYASSSGDPRMDDNLASLSDGAGRLLEAFTYQGGSNPQAVDYDTCATHDRHRSTGGSGAGNGVYVMFHIEASNDDSVRLIGNDETGCVTETTFDRLHRVTSVRRYTGFSIPGVVVTSTSNRPEGKLHASDPDYFETTCAYNADNLCVRVTRPDGSRELVTYDRDFRKDCPVRERGNARVVTLGSSDGASRSLTFDYLPGFGGHEPERPGNPIGGLTIKGGRNPGPGMSPARLIWSPRSNLADQDDSDGDGAAHVLKKEEGGRHTPFHNKDRPLLRDAPAAGIAGGAVAGIVIAAVISDSVHPSSGADQDDSDTVAGAAFESQRPYGAKQKAWMVNNFSTRMVSANGQVSTSDYDDRGNLTRSLSPLPGKGCLYQYNTLGQPVSRTVLDGEGSSFVTGITYGADHFPASVVEDPSGLHLTTTLAHDAQGRLSAVTDPNGNDWLFSHNPLNQRIGVQSPSMPNRISMNLTIDAGGRPARCDIEHRGPDGSLVAGNPAYSTFLVYDDRGNLARLAREERPVNSPPSALAPPEEELASYDVCDFQRDDAGRIIRISTPAECRGQATALACDFRYNERGQLDRCIEGGLGTPGSVTRVFLYDSLGAVVSSSTLVPGQTGPETRFTYDGFHRLASVTDAMGNVVEHAYGNDGSVTTSFSGELEDQPGSGQNQLLAKEKIKGDYLPAHNFHLELDRCFPTYPFFHVETEDEEFSVERFTPGSSAPAVVETTVIDRSPAGLIRQISRNGDALAVLTYDTAGRSLTCSNAATTRSVTRDANGRVLICCDTQHFSVSGLPGKKFTLTFTRDALGRCTQATDGVGNTTLFTYDSLGRPVAETEPGGLVIHTDYDGSSTTGLFSAQVSADFDGDGNEEILGSSLVRCGALVASTDSHGFPTSYTLDALGRCVRCDRPDGTFESTTFDGRGFPVQATFADGSSRSSSLDLLGRVTLTTWTLPPAPTTLVATPDTSFVYDGLGQLRSCLQGSTSVTATYDSCGNQTSETTNGLTISRSFNHRGRTGITYPDGKRFQEVRNAFGDLVSVSAVTPTGVVVSPPIVSLDHLGHEVFRTVQRNGVTTTHTHRADAEQSPAGNDDRSFGACVRTTVTDASGNVLSDTLIGRDANQRTCTCHEGYHVGSLQKARITVTPRDRFGNIASCVISRQDAEGLPPVVESSVSYTHDPDGTRLSEVRNATPGSYTRSPLPPAFDLQAGRYSSWPGGALTWTPDGNLATLHNGSSQQTFVHDVQGRLVRVDDAGGNLVAAYGYDGLGQRISKLDHSPTTGDLEIIIRFVHDAGTCIQEIGNDNLADMTLVCADGIRQCISTRNGTIYYPHGGGGAMQAGRGVNHWGDRVDFSGGLDPCDAGLRLITNDQGAPVERLGFDDSGAPLFLTAEGSASSTSASSIGLRWLAADRAWEPGLRMYAGADGVYSPDLAQQVSKPKPKRNTVKLHWDLAVMK